MRIQTCYLVGIVAALVSGGLFEETGAAAPAVPEDVVWRPGVEYANVDGVRLELDPAQPKNGQGPFPAVLCIHGGGFRAGNRESYDGLCIKLAKRGYVAATMTYRLAPKYKFPAAVHDTKAAVRWLAANAADLKINPEKIGVTGGSAGGHLAQFLGVTAHVPEFEGTGGNPEQSSSVTCVVNFYGPSDFTKSYGKSVDAAQVLPLVAGRKLGDGTAAAHQGQPALLGHARRRLRLCACTEPRTNTSPTNRLSGSSSG